MVALEYYGRILRNVRGKILVFSKDQIITGAVAAVISAVLAIFLKLTPLRPGVAMAVFALLGYLVVVLLRFLILALQEPAALDQQQARELDRLIAEVATLRQALEAKHPHDVHLEERARQVLGRLDQHERAFVSLLLDRGNIPRAELAPRGYANAPQTIAEKAPHNGFIPYEPWRPGNGVVDLGGHYFLNPNLLPSIRNVLHPPSPPVP